VQVLGAENGGMGLCPQQGPGAEPLVRRSGGKGDRDEVTLRLKHCFWTFNGYRKFSLVSKIRKQQNKIFRLFLTKMKLNKPQFVTVYCELKKSNNSDI